MKKPLLVVLLVVFFDQVSKIWVKLNMYLGEEYRVFDWFYIHFTENNGMAFGMEFAGAYGKLFLTLFRILAVLGMLYYIKTLVRDQAPKGLIYSIALIMAGALGNILDSVFYGVLFDSSYHHVASFLPESGGYASFFHGRVVDMLYFPLISGHFPDWMPIWGGDYFIFFRPVFNLADSAITAGVLLILINQKHFFEKPQKLAENQESAEDSTEKEIEN